MFNFLIMAEPKTIRNPFFQKKLPGDGLPFSVSAFG